MNEYIMIMCVYIYIFAWLVGNQRHAYLALSQTRCRVAAPCWFSMPCCGSAGERIPGCCCSSFGHGKGVGRKRAAQELEATAKYLAAPLGHLRLQGSERLKPETIQSCTQNSGAQKQKDTKSQSHRGRKGKERDQKHPTTLAFRMFLQRNQLQIPSLKIQCTRIQ